MLSNPPLTPFARTNRELKFHYIWTKPQFLVTYMYSIMFIVLGGSQANALQFASSVIAACTSPDAPVDPRLQKFIAVAIVGLICLLQVYSRNTVVRLNNVLAAYKLLFLLFIMLLGFCALGGVRTAAASATGSPYGIVNLQASFAGTSTKPYGWGVALLVVQRAYLGYENANFVGRMNFCLLFSSPLIFIRFWKKFTALLVTQIKSSAGQPGLRCL
jgi:amino acid transporter